MGEAEFSALNFGDFGSGRLCIFLEVLLYLYLRYELLIR